MLETNNQKIKKNSLVGLVKNYKSTGSMPYFILIVFLLIPGLGPYKLFLLKHVFDRHWSQGEFSLGHMPITKYSLWPEKKKFLFGVIWVF